MQFFRSLLVGRYNQLARIHNDEPEEEDSGSDDDETGEWHDRLKQLDTRFHSGFSGAREPTPKRRRVAS